MSLPNFLTKIFSGGAGELIGKVGAVIDDLNLSKEEKEQLRIELLKTTNEHMEHMAGLAQAETDSYFKDIDSARTSNATIQTSDKAGWLAKNVAYCIDIFIVLIWGAMTVYVIAKQLNLIKAQIGVDFSGVLGIYAGVTALATQIISFHRGSSKGSEKKTEALERMAK